MSVIKKPRRVINLETKLDIIKRSEKGFSGAAIARALGLRDSTVRTILKNGDRIKRIYAERKYPRDKKPILAKNISLEIEHNIITWYTNEVRNSNIIDYEEFKTKALSVYTELTRDFSNVGMFTVSKDLFEFCKRTYGTVSDTSSEAASADNEEITPVATLYCEVVQDDSDDIQAANTFSQTFHEIMEEGGYTPMQIFTVSETHLFWKRLPVKETNDKLDVCDSIDHVTLLLGCNASGDFKLKPLLVNFIENSKALLGYPKEKLPVTWKTNKKASVTQLIFSDWFTSYFCPAVESYCIKNNLDNKILLVMNSSPGYPTSLDDLSANVKVLFFPQKASPILHPLDKSFMKIFKSNYYYKALSQALIESENAKPDGLNFGDLWKSYNIRKAINNIVEAWYEIQPQTMSKVWKELLPNYMIDFSECNNEIDNIHESIIEIAKELGLEEINIDYLNEELNFDVDKISNEQMVELLNKKNLENIENDNDIIQIKSLSVTMLGDAINNLENAMTIIRENDPDTERSSFVCNTIRNITASYRQLYRDKKKSSDLLVRKYGRKHPSQNESSEASFDLQSTNSNEPQPSNIPVDIKLEFSPGESADSDV